MVFLFADTQIVIEAFVEDINNILNSGEVPNLFANDEWEKIIGACRTPNPSPSPNPKHPALNLKP